MSDKLQLSKHAKPRHKLRPLSGIIRGALFASAGALIVQGTTLELAHAGPQGGKVVAGQGQIDAPNAATTVVQQQSHSLVVNWRTFDVKNNELVQFNQPSSSASALNRVMNQSPSQIFGSVRANGKVFLLNPSGVVIGKGARLNVGSLFVTSLDIGNADFMNGKYAFKAGAGITPGAIVNRGLIQAASGGSVTLVGGQITNEGLIVANAGHVNLAAGRTATVDFNGDGLIRFEVDGKVLENAGGADAAVANSGEIRADGGQVLLAAATARGVFDRAINNTGLIRAGGIRKRGGKVTLTGVGAAVSNTGSIDASGSSGGEVHMASDSAIEQYGTLRAEGSEEKGGLVRLASLDTTLVGGNSVTSARSGVDEGGIVQVLGKKVAVYDEARVDASGGAGGGSVRVGGSFQGRDPDVRNATATYVGPNAKIDAEARDSGNGGTVIVWADDITRFYGDITARGGAHGGDGGLVEVSGKRTLVFQGGVATSAPNGQAGVLLLDPTTITITAATDSNISAGPTFTNSPTPTAVSDVAWTTLEAALAGGTVAVQTTEDIIVSAGFDFSSNDTAFGTLELNAGTDITTSGAVTVSGRSANQISLSLAAAGAVVMGANFANFGDVKFDVGAASTYSGVVSGTGTLTKAGAGSLILSGSNSHAGLTTVGAGTLMLGAAGTGANGPLGTIAAGTSVTSGAALDLNGFTLATAEPLTLNGTGIAGGGALTNSGASANYSGLVTLGSASSIVASGGAIDITNTGTITGATFGLTLGGASDGSVASIIGTTSGALSKAGAGTWTLSGLNTYTGLTTINAGTLKLGAAGAGANGPLGTIAAGTVVIGGAVLDLNGFTLATAEALTLDGTGGGNGALANSSVTDASYSGLVALDGASSIVASAGDIDLTNAGTVTGAGFDLTLGGAGNGSVASIIGTATGTLTKAGAGTWALLGANTYTGLTTINAGTLALGNATNTLADAGAATVDGATAILALGANDDTVAGVQLIDGSITGTGGTLTSTSNFDVRKGSVSAILGGAVGLTKSTGDTLTLSGANTYTGLTTVNAGTLALGNATNTLADAGAVTVDGTTAILALGANDDTVAGVQLIDGSVTGTGGTLISTSNFDVRKGSVSAILGGAVGLTKSTGDTLTLSGANTYAGLTTVSAGTLRLGAANVIPDGAGKGNVSVTGGATLDLNGFNETLNALSGAGTVDKLAGAGAATLTVGNNDQTSTFSGVINDTTGTLVLTKVGTGTLALSGPNTYTGSTTVSAGTLSVTNNTSLGDPGAGTTVNVGATLNSNGLSIATGQFEEPITFNGSTLLSAGALGAGAGGLLTIAAGGVTVAGSVSLVDDVILAAGGPLTLNAPVTANGRALAVIGGSTNLNASIGESSGITFAALKVTGHSTLTTDALTLNGAVTGSKDLTILRRTAADVELGGTTDTVFKQTNLDQFVDFAGALNIGGSRDAAPGAVAQVLRDIEVTSALSTTGDVFVIGAGDVKFSGAGRIISPTGTVSVLALGSAGVADSGNLQDDSPLPSPAAPSFIEANTLELLAATQIGSELSSKGGTFNVTANIVSAAQGVAGDAQVDNTNKSARSSQLVLDVQSVYALASAPGEALANVFNDSFRRIGSVSSLSVTTIATPKQSKGALGFVDEGVFLLPSSFTNPVRSLLMPVLGDPDFPGDQRPQEPDDEDAWLAFFEDVVREFIARRHPLAENASAAERAAVEALVTSELQTVIAYYEKVRERERLQLATQSAAQPSLGWAPPRTFFVDSVLYFPHS